ncbi:hypothetical protein ACIGXA_39525 [Streptomyces fildesensis]|uniref:Uncharacterized protein n=1 Tax=Streptomyces fildesensis TaxID=375757 RepID=A0ABW8CMQ1_9ACTN
MSLPVIAIAIAGSSMLGTLFNMLTSVLTYRRVRPRAKVRTQWQLPDPNRQPELQVHVSNLSPTATMVKEVRLIGRYRKDERALLPRAIAAGPPGVIYPFIRNYFLVRIDSEHLFQKSASPVKQDMNMLAFGGLWWDLADPSADLAEGWTHLAIEVTLMSGNRKRSNWIRPQNISWMAYALATIFGVGDLAYQMKERQRPDRLKD